MATGRESLSESKADSANAPSEGAGDGGEEQRAASFLEKCAVFTMTFGPGCAVATYTTLFGWYQHVFHSSQALVWMRIALFAPYPLIKMLQQRYDAYFDEMFTVRSTYLFRVVIMQLVVAMLMLVWMFLPVSIADFASIIAFGAVLGCCCSPVIGSTMQIAIAIDPILSVWTQLGNFFGMAVPVIVVYASGFSSSSSHANFCKLVAFPMLICILSFMWLGSLHYADVFSPAVLTITQRRTARVSRLPEVEANPQEEFNGVPSSDAEAAKLLNHADMDPNTSEMPRWVWFWLAANTLGLALDFFVLTLIGYFGTAQTTIHLATGTLVCSVVGRLLTLPWRHLPAFEKGPMHISGGIFFTARLCLWFALLLKLLKVWSPPFHTVLAVWCLWIVFANVFQGLTDLTVTANVSEAKKELAMQYILIGTYSGLFVGMLTASILVLASESSIQSQTPSAFLEGYQQIFRGHRNSKLFLEPAHLSSASM
mmetsp:Transcript_83115/g.144402  ORF Transcript_83115/g.144402 Transcript_83115/m.144402 type:complete len:482 (-) Transcript_83115:77-1522(-)